MIVKWTKQAAIVAPMSMALLGLPAATASAAGPYIPYGAIAAEWQAKGGASGFLGQPTSFEYDVPGVSGARVEEFVGGQIYWSLDTGAHEVHGSILVEYGGPAGGAAGYGLPLTDETPTPDGIGRFNHFQYARSIYWTNAYGAHTVLGAIRANWAATGWERGPLGYPTRDESTDTLAPNEQVQTFDHGQEFWLLSTGAHEVHGAILTEYLASAGGPVTFGLPLTDEVTAPDRVGRFNHFEGGSIYWTPATGAHAVHGAIGAAWAGTGWERGPLGYPVSDEFVPTLAVREADFQHGYINYVNGVITVHVFVS